MKENKFFFKYIVFIFCYPMKKLQQTKPLILIAKANAWDDFEPVWRWFWNWRHKDKSFALDRKFFFPLIIRSFNLSLQSSCYIL